MVIKNLENKIKLVMNIICSLFLVGCIIICISSIWTAKQMVSDAHQKVYVLDGNVPILVSAAPWKKHSMWKQRAMWRCSTITSSLLRQMTSTSNTQWIKPCIWSMKRVLRSTIR